MIELQTKLKAVTMLNDAWELFATLMVKTTMVIIPFAVLGNLTSIEAWYYSLIDYHRFLFSIAVACAIMIYIVIAESILSD